MPLEMTRLHKIIYNFYEGIKPSRIIIYNLENSRTRTRHKRNQTSVNIVKEVPFCIDFVL